MNFTYIVFDRSEINKVVLSELLPFSAEPLRLSSDGTKCYAKYIGTMPPSLQTLTTKSPEYTRSQIGNTLIAERWASLIQY
jgi:hypothetical protein